MHRRLATALAVLGLTIAACGGEPTGEAGPTPSGHPQVRDALITPSTLPAGFRESSGLSSGYRFTLCGVDLEPTPPVETAAARFAKSEIGPFVEQRVRRYPDDSQTDVISAMTQALDRCSTTTVADPSTGQRTTFRVSPLDLPPFGDQSVAWHQVAEGSPQVPTDVVLMRRGRTVVLVTSYTFERSTDPVSIADAAQAAADRLESLGTSA